MASWASIANKGPQAPAEPSGIAATTQEKSCAVIDTNAIIDGSQLRLYGEQLATIPEVLAEVKDKKTRDFLERFPFKLQSMEPDSESLRAGQLRSCSADCAVWFYRDCAMCSVLGAVTSVQDTWQSPQASGVSSCDADND